MIIKNFKVKENFWEEFHIFGYSTKTDSDLIINKPYPKFKKFYLQQEDKIESKKIYKIIYMDLFLANQIVSLNNEFSLNSYHFCGCNESSIDFHPFVINTGSINQHSIYKSKDFTKIKEFVQIEIEKILPLKENKKFFHFLYQWKEKEFRLQKFPDYMYDCYVDEYMIGNLNFDQKQQVEDAKEVDEEFLKIKFVYKMNQIIKNWKLKHVFHFVMNNKEDTLFIMPMIFVAITKYDSIIGWISAANLEA